MAESESGARPTAGPPVRHPLKTEWLAPKVPIHPKTIHGRQTASPPLLHVRRWEQSSSTQRGTGHIASATRSAEKREHRSRRSQRFDQPEDNFRAARSHTQTHTIGHPEEKMSRSAVLLLPLFMLFVFLLSLDGCDAKRGCANFGHSCYGGMGKRASTGDLYDTNEEVLQNGFQDAEENPAFVFTGPRSSYQPKPKLTPQQYDNISRIIKSWIQSISKSQERRADNI
ncbi:uncharacterized protein LOC109608532 [Aethina tumida]|uniref:uncharacterized protein LOC109608532 n=1 Tax=Aethina tumida TaxID=116153 RepID=UPI00096B4C4C|nr:uncharacterized protein LOC109608532 [Aethina tumida]